ncbi:unnamed protein product, partial [Staurois parvus]
FPPPPPNLPQSPLTTLPLRSTTQPLVLPTLTSPLGPKSNHWLNLAVSASGTFPKSLTNDTTKQLIHALVISRLHYCNSLLTGLPLHRLSPLQSIMNAAARLIHLTNRSAAAAPLCQSLHWLPFSVLHPSLPIPSLASILCPPPLSANPSTDLHSVSSTPLCQSLH